MEELDYVADIRIDPTALDVEWLRQADLMRKYATHAAATKMAMDDAKERLDVVKAQLDRDIRKDPSQFGLDKVTETAVQSTILLQEAYTQGNQAWSEARYENDIANAAVRAIDQKKTALENLVRLLTASYFAGPQAPRDVAREWQERNERRANNARVRMTRRTKQPSA